jgi:hypothetical protein
MGNNAIAERIRRSMEREKAEKAQREADPDGRAAHASGRSFTQAPSAEKELTPVVETPDNSLTFEATVERNWRKVGMSPKDSLGNLEMNLKRGGSISGTLALRYLNEPLLLALTKLRGDGSNQSRRFKVTISIEE